MTDYLRRLPASARYPGSAENGEILLVATTEELAAAQADRDAEVSARGLPPDAARFGIVFEDEYLLVVRDAVRFTSGRYGTYVRIFEKSSLDGPSGVVVVPIRDGRVILRNMFRHATRAWELECPRGFREHGQAPADTVKVEVDQELGLPLLRVTHLGSISPNTGLFAGIAEAYVVDLGPGAPKPRPEEREAFGRIEELSPSEVTGAVVTGRIRDGLTLAALMLAHGKKFVRLGC